MFRAEHHRGPHKYLLSIENQKAEKPKHYFSISNLSYRYLPEIIRSNCTLSGNFETLNDVLGPVEHSPGARAIADQFVKAV